MTPQLFTIQLGIQSDDYLKLNGLDETQNLDRQPAGLNFYEKDWPSDNRGTVFVNHGKYSFQIKNILHAIGTEDADNPEKGITKFNLNGGGAAQSLDFHNAVRQRFLAFLDELSKAGWRRVIDYSEPRLKGDSAFRYLLEESTVYSPPLDYSFTLEQWMKIRGPHWRLYADGVFLDISFSRDRKAMEPNGYGSYLFSYSLYDAEGRGANHMKYFDRPHWKELWVEKIKELKKLRYAKEAELKAQGYTIDMDYQDPMIHPADPVEP